MIFQDSFSKTAFPVTIQKANVYKRDDYVLQVLQVILSESSHRSRGEQGLAARARDLMEAFVCQESWQLLSHRLLCLMDEEELLQVRCLLVI